MLSAILAFRLVLDLIFIGVCSALFCCALPVGHAEETARSGILLLSRPFALFLQCGHNEPTSPTRHPSALSVERHNGTTLTNLVFFA